MEKNEKPDTSHLSVNKQLLVDVLWDVIQHAREQMRLQENEKDLKEVVQIRADG